jgi:hypothetical protein
MNHASVRIHVINHGLSQEMTAPTIPIAIAHCLPDFSHGVGDSRTILGIRPYGKYRRSYHGYGLVIHADEDTFGDQVGRYKTRRIEVGEDIEAFDVWEELNSIEGGLRYFAQDKIDDPKFHQGIIDRGIAYVEAVNQVLLYDPKAKIELSETLEEIFDGADWGPWMRSLPVAAPVVDVRNVEAVERDEDTMLLRFEYYFAAPGGLSVHERELEFADRTRGGWKIRRGRFSALRGLQPPFNGWQLPQVYSDLQKAMDEGRVRERIFGTLTSA